MACSDRPAGRRSHLAEVVGGPAWTNVLADGTTQWTDDGIRADVGRAAIDYYGVGLIYAAQGNKEEARAAYNHALAMLPSFAEAQTALQALK